MTLCALSLSTRLSARRMSGLRQSAGAAALLMALQAAASPAVQPLFKSSTDGLGRTLTYPGGAAAELTGAIVTLPPGESTGWHRHAIPVAGYLLEGELTVEYASGEQRVFRAGAGIIEVQDAPHQGYNAGTKPVRIVVFYAGAPGVPPSEAVSPPSGDE
jgi:quercetin dioxygenase-like cupin family protein